MNTMLLLVLLSVLTTMKTCQGYCEESDEEPAASGLHVKTSDTTGKLPSLLMKRFFDGLSHDGFVGLMGKRNIGTKEIPQLQKRDMHDFFVGLMGRRNAELSNLNGLNKEASPDVESPVLPSKCRMRFRHA
ncbi:tachykinin-3 [Protopterus annectens]|uniref:tachykinin-3 n=1 Tax=Protopterus annectens TaxID=7888 RepID=UPI001CF9D008|nr:tachykinin-3 [Protopterus annectens]